jgi:hypothetical protein
VGNQDASGTQGLHPAVLVGLLTQEHHAALGSVLHSLLTDRQAYKQMGFTQAYPAYTAEKQVM